MTTLSPGLRILFIGAGNMHPDAPSNHALVRRVVNAVHPSLAIHGAGWGCDSIVATVCHELDVRQLAMPAPKGKGSTAMRGAWMESMFVREAGRPACDGPGAWSEAPSPDALVAFPGKSGTESMIAMAHHFGVPVWRVDVDASRLVLEVAPVAPAVDEEELF